MTATQTWILRSSVVLGMVVAVVTVLYLTPMPEHHYMSCDRPCHELEWPMICRIRLNLELYHTLGRSCEDCPKNATNCNNKQCIVADGHRRSLLTANRQLPGPSINVCQNDILVMDVVNQVPGREFTIHWRGQQQQATPCMDGTPMITQCPIPSYTTFQYKFRATAAGTHLWHAHSNSHLSDGLFGALIVRQPDIIEPQKRLYDKDDNSHVLLITEWNQKLSLSKSEIPPSLLINGRGNFNGFKPEFKVKGGLRYRFRVAFTSGTIGCPIELKIENHLLKVISVDGNPTAPYEVTSVVLGKGERIDFVLKANQVKGHYPLKVASKCAVDSESNQVAVSGLLVYDGMEKKRNVVDFEENEVKEEALNDNSRVFYTNACDSKLGKVCINDVQSLFVMPAALRSEKIDHKLHLVFDHLTVAKYGTNKLLSKMPLVNNISFTFPSSPLLTQIEDVVPGMLCNTHTKPAHCQGHHTCECVHVEHIPLDNSVEIILINRGDDEENVFHLHGYHFYVVGSRQFSEPVTLEEIKDLDDKNLLFKRNLKSPANKDTIRIPKYGVVAIRFVANNPGYWMLRDEHATHWSRGMDLIFHVGNWRDYQKTPSDFPKCGNWIGPEFFLA